MSENRLGQYIIWYLKYRWVPAVLLVLAAIGAVKILPGLVKEPYTFIVYVIGATLGALVWETVRYNPGAAGQESSRRHDDV